MQLAQLKWIFYWKIYVWCGQLNKTLHRKQCQTCPTKYTELIKSKWNVVYRARYRQNSQDIFSHVNICAHNTCITCSHHTQSCGLPLVLHEMTATYLSSFFSLVHLATNAHKTRWKLKRKTSHFISLKCKLKSLCFSSLSVFQAFLAEAIRIRTLIIVIKTCSH